MLANSSHLKSEGYEWYSNVYISPDLTKVKREKQKQLWAELKRREGGETGLVIYSGQKEISPSMVDVPPVTLLNNGFFICWCMVSVASKLFM